MSFLGQKLLNYKSLLCVELCKKSSYVQSTKCMVMVTVVSFTIFVNNILSYIGYAFVLRFMLDKTKNLKAV